MQKHRKLSTADNVEADTDGNLFVFDSYYKCLSDPL